MNSKIIAVFAALAMVFVGFTAVAVDADGAGAKELGKVSVIKGETDNSTIVAVNEGNYEHYEYTLTWEMKVEKDTQIIGTINSGTPDFGTYYVNATSISDTDSDDDKFTVKMESTGTKGVYKLVFTGTAATEAIDYILTASITVSLDGASKIIKDFATFTGSVAVFESSSGKIVVTLDDSNAKVGTMYDKQVSLPTGMTVSDYDWYAVGLPTGLTMSVDGHVSGIPTVSITADKDYTFRVYATDKDGNIYYCDIAGFTIQKKDSPNVASYNYSINEIKNEPLYMFEANESIILKITQTVGDTAITNATVKTVGDSSGDLDQTIPYIENEDYSGYKLPSNGSGAYTVQITYGGVTTSFTVYIIGEATGIDASIVIEGA